MILVGILFAVLSDIFKPKDAPDSDIFIYKLLFAIIITIIIWEGNLRIDNWLNKTHSWLLDTRKRLFIQIFVSPLFTIGMLFLLISFAHLILKHPNKVHAHHFDPLFIPGLFIAFFILTIEISHQFFKSWKQSLLEVEKYKTEIANAQLQNLRNQLNPHFLFNNLSVLTSLIYKSQDKAVDFINELSKVYRYSLENKNDELVLLEDELNFLEHYLYLLKIRFEGNIVFRIDIDENKKKTFLPPMCLQILVENTIQHNVASQANPLKVSIYTNEDSIIIENPIQPRTDKAESSKIGLANIQSRYSYFTDEKAVITTNDNIFKIALPLIVKQ
jgi:sensor histidine kinase YesM